MFKVEGHNTISNQELNVEDSYTKSTVLKINPYEMKCIKSK